MIDFDGMANGACMAAFGEQVVYQPDGAPLTITGIFDRRYREDALDTEGVPITLTRPVLTTRTAFFPPGQPVQGATLAIRGARYTITQPPEPDGMGSVKLILTYASDGDATLPAAAPVPPAPGAP